MMPDSPGDPVWRGTRYGHWRPIVVGLVNNMPDGALRNTELQFRGLLADAAGDRPIIMRVFTLSELPRSDAGRRYVRDNYRNIEELWDTELDGLIVTGTPPRAGTLSDEPYWPTLVRLVDWAAQHTTTTVWSCLAAHAAAYALDGIERHPFASKLSGVFDCTRSSDHPLVRFGLARWSTPHSRYNDLPSGKLLSHGYQILSRVEGAGADIFIKKINSLFVFFQGHLEYDPAALLREYHRDVGRFLEGHGDFYPEMPCGYFEGTAARALLTFRERAESKRDPALLSQFPMEIAEQHLRGGWRDAATGLFARWVSHMAERKSFRLKDGGPRRSSAARSQAVLMHG